MALLGSAHLAEGVKTNSLGWMNSSIDGGSALVGRAKQHNKPIKAALLMLIS